MSPGTYIYVYIYTYICICTYIFMKIYIIKQYPRGTQQRCNTLHNAATRCNTLQHTAAPLVSHVTHHVIHEIESYHKQKGVMSQIRKSTQGAHNDARHRASPPTPTPLDLPPLLRTPQGAPAASENSCCVVWVWVLVLV